MHGRLQVAQLVTIDGDSSRPLLSFVVVESSAAEVVLKLSGTADLLKTIAPGQNVRLSLSDSTGLHRAQALVKDVITEPYPGLLVSPPQAFHTTQNRNFFRVYTKLSAPYRILASATASAAGQEDRDAFTQDISAGGVRLWTLLPLQVGDRVHVRLICPADDDGMRSRPGRAGGEDRTVALHAEVLRVARLPTIRKTCYTVGARFVDLSVREQDRLVGLMFDLQRRLQNP